MRTLRHVEGAKWLALALMVVDHVNTGILHGAQPWMFNAGRLVMPTFAVVLGYNLARYGRDDDWLAYRMWWRLLGWGLVAQVPFWIFFQHAHLNILLAMAGTALAVHLWGYTAWAIKASAILPVVVVTLACEFSIVLPVVVFAAMAWTRRIWWALPLSIAAAALVVLDGRTAWGLTFPVLFWISGALWPAGLSRSGRVFYWAYPAHLVVLVAIGVMIGV